MNTYIEPLYKSAEYIDFGWNSEPGATGYRMYVGISPLALSLVYGDITAQASDSPQNRGKVPWRAQIADVRTTLSLTSGNFADTVFYFAITYLNGAGSESALSASTVVKVPPVGITLMLQKDDPTASRHNFYFSEDLQRWVKATGTSTGAVIVDSGDYYKSNLTTEYTYDGTNVKTIKSYPSDATVAGSPAKLTTYTYTGSQVIKISITDSTV